MIRPEGLPPLPLGWVWDFGLATYLWGRRRDAAAIEQAIDAQDWASSHVPHYVPRPRRA